MKMSKNSSNIKQYKILLLGDSDSNKTKIFNKIINEFDKPANATVGVDFLTKNFEYKNKIYSIILFDTAGIERFLAITKSYFHMGHGFFIVVNLSNENSLYSIEKYIKSLKEEILSPKIVILGNETQSINNIPDNIINQYLKNYPEYKFLKVCAEKNKNIMQALYAMIDLFQEEEEKDELKIDFDNHKLKKHCI